MYKESGWKVFCGYIGYSDSLKVDLWESDMLLSSAEKKLGGRWQLNLVGLSQSTSFWTIQMMRPPLLTIARISFMKLEQSYPTSLGKPTAVLMCSPKWAEIKTIKKCAYLFLPTLYQRKRNATWEEWLIVAAIAHFPFMFHLFFSAVFFLLSSVFTKNKKKFIVLAVFKSSKNFLRITKSKWSTFVREVFELKIPRFAKIKYFIYFIVNIYLVILVD